MGHHVRLKSPGTDSAVSCQWREIGPQKVDPSHLWQTIVHGSPALEEALPSTDS